MMHWCGSANSNGGNNMVGGACSCGMYQQNNSYDDYFYSTSSSTVDCTLSLGTPSTRLISSSNESGNNNSYLHHEKKKSSCMMSGFGWNVLPSSKHTTANSAASKSSGYGGDSLLTRRCANCDTTSTPLWRNGPRGPKSLCNACGIRFKKEERRATAAAAACIGGGGGGAQPQKIPCYYSTTPYYDNEHRFTEDNQDRDIGYPFLSWRFNVTDWPSLSRA